ncbi:MAG TPA: hypothetical protein VIH16_06765 [Bellilinea sp.]
MDMKKVTWLQNIDTADIWYCEGSEKQLYLGLLKDGGRHKMVSVVAETPEEALEKMSEGGVVVLARSMRDIISDFLVEDDPIEH